MAVIGLCTSGVVAPIATPFLVRTGDWKYLAFFWLLVALPAAVIVVLRSRRAMSLRALRIVELTVVVVLVGAHVFDTYYSLVRQRQGAVFAKLGEVVVSLPPHAYREGDNATVALAGWFSLFWVALLVGYGIFIPNTWKRAAAVVTVLALIPVVLHGAVCLTDPDMSAQSAAAYMLVIFGSMAFTAAMVLFGLHRFESLRQEAVAARRLGQYQLKELLGRGGMGEVYRAEHLLLRRACAVKLIRPERAGDPANLRRFEREVQATATLTNWHTVEIFDYGHAADGTFYYVMEYLPGLTLDELVSRHGPLPPGRAVHLLRQVCAALREAHGIGLIHRDIKPGNVILGERGGQPDVAKLLDFGLVRTTGLDLHGEKLTQTGLVVGTPAYLSPEQAGGGDVDARSDVYSLGAVAYFLLTGRPPFMGKSPLHVLAAHLREDAGPLTDHRADCPADLQAVVLRCLEKEPERRFPDIDRLDAALAACACAEDWDAARAAVWWRDHGRDGTTEAP
jgi:serine/threonine-protein kinase